jgi:hypothetical protein
MKRKKQQPQAASNITEDDETELRICLYLIDDPKNGLTEEEYLFSILNKQWKCSKCTMRNVINDKICQMCLSEKDESAEIVTWENLKRGNEEISETDLLYKRQVILFSNC